MGNVSKNLRFLNIAAKEIGVKERTGRGDNPRIVEYHRSATHNPPHHKKTPDSVPWCSSFACWVVQNAGIEPTRSRAARSWLKWGSDVKRHSLTPGDIVVYYRDSINSWKGHVGFYLAQSDNIDFVLGGNQKDEVCVSGYSHSRFLGGRRCKKKGFIDHYDLRQKAHEILDKAFIHMNDADPPGMFELAFNTAYKTFRG